MTSIFPGKPNTNNGKTIKKYRFESINHHIYFIFCVELGFHLLVFYPLMYFYLCLP